MHDHNYYNQQLQPMQASMSSALQLPPQQQQQQPQNIPTYYQYSPSHIQYPIGPEPTNSPTFCYNCQNNNQHGNNMDNETRIKATVIEELANKTSLEDLVKLVVAAVKDAGVLGKSDKKQESPEEILRRKRQQVCYKFNICLILLFFDFIIICKKKIEFFHLCFFRIMKQLHAIESDNVKLK